MVRTHPGGVAYDVHEFPSKCEAPPHVPTQTSSRPIAATAVGPRTGAGVQALPSKCNSTASCDALPGVPFGPGITTLDTQTSSSAVPVMTPSVVVVPLDMDVH